MDGVLYGETRRGNQGNCSYRMWKVILKGLYVRYPETEIVGGANEDLSQTVAQDCIGLGCNPHPISKFQL